MTSSGPLKASTPQDAEQRRGGRDRARSSLGAQWMGLFLAPAVFFAHLQLAYVLVPWSCATGNRIWPNVVDALSVTLAAGGVLIARHVWSRDDMGQESGAGGPSSRARFLGITGTVTGAMFVLLLAAQWAASWLISPCQ
jgi:hypothetical protein